MNIVDRLLQDRHDELDLEGLGLGRGLRTVLLTPRFVASRHVVGLVYPAAGGSPALVAKFPRRPGDNGGVRREADVLRLLNGGSAQPFDGAPRLIGLVAVQGHDVLLETAVDGTPLDPREVARDLPGAVAAGVAFTGALPVTRPEHGRDWYEETIAEPLRHLVEVVPLGSEMARMVEETHRFLLPLKAVALPAVVEHGDLSHPNIFRRPDGQLQVIDWERCSVAGLPGLDIVFYLTYLSEAVRSAWSAEAKLRAFDNAFVGPGAWAAPAVRGHLKARGLDPALSPQLIVATWARSASSLVTRLLPGAGGGRAFDPTAEQIGAAVSQDRDLLLWRHALRRRADLSW